MRLFIASYIEKFLKKANYEYDKKTQSWCASVDELPGVYAQADTVEELRQQLAEVIEDYVIVSLREHQRLPNFNIRTKKSFKEALINV